MWAIQILSLLCLLTVGVHSTALDDVCATTAECVVDNTNSYCQQLYSSGDTCIIGKACKCRRGHTGATCTAAPYLGETCAVLADCVAVTGAVCTALKCACPTGQTQVSKYNCVASTSKKIGEACTSGTNACYYENEGVLLSNGVCTSSICVCPAGTKKSGSTCKPVKIEEACTATTECPLKSTCTGSPTVCTCESLFVATTDKTACVLTTSPLAADAVCVITEHKCDHNANLACVACTPPVVGTTKCALKAGLIGDTCEISSDCSSKVAECTGTPTKTCTCGAGYEAYGNSMCLPTGEHLSACWTPGDCTVADNICKDNVCDICTDTDKEPNTGRTACVCKAAKPVEVNGACVTGVTVQVNTRPTQIRETVRMMARPALDATCTTTADCKTTNQNSYCQQLYSSGDTCIIGQVCKCKRGYTGATCAAVPKYLGETCAVLADCAAVTRAECTGTPLKCACPSTQTQVSKYNCVASTYKKIGEACTGTDTCYYENEGVVIKGTCTGSPTTCTCPDRTKKSGSTCKPVKIAEACTADTECPVKSTCAGSPTVCTCESSFGPTTDKTACVLTSSPLAADAECIIGEHKCNHNANLACVACTPAVPATTQCALKTGLIGDTCEINSDCSSKVAECTGTTPKTCTCGAGYEAYGKSMCLPTGEHLSACWTPGDCTVTSNICKDNVCDICTDTDKEPNADRTACVCKAAKPVGVNGACVTGQLGSACTEVAHCKFENSLCTGSKCACAVGFKVDSTKCVADSGVAGLKAAWIPLITLSTLITILSLTLF